MANIMEMTVPIYITGVVVYQLPHTSKENELEIKETAFLRNSVPYNRSLDIGRYMK